MIEILQAWITKPSMTLLDAGELMGHLNDAG
jgi:hypothetical protein